MDLKSGKYLIPSFFGMLFFVAAIHLVECSPYLMGLRGYGAAIMGAGLALGAAISVVIFLATYVATIPSAPYAPTISWTMMDPKKMAYGILGIVILKLFLLTYGNALSYLVPRVCSGYINQ